MQPARTLERRDKRPDAATAIRPIRVMIVDDSLVVRTVLSKILRQTPGLEEVAAAGSAEAGLALLDKVSVDIILLDLEMPGIGGLAALPQLLARAGGAKIIVVSSLTREGAQASVEALSMGAADTVGKPTSGQFTADYRHDLAERIIAIGASRATVFAAPPPISEAAAPRASLADGPIRPVSALAIGASTGGIHAICKLLGQLPRDFLAPILVTQHLPAAFGELFARQLAVASGRPATIAQSGMRLVPGEIFVAPGDGHMLVERQQEELVIRIAHFRADSGCCPSIDPMLGSLATALPAGALAIILSGMGRDGLSGARAHVAAGGRLLAQDPHSASVWGMPGAVVEAGLTDAVLPPQDMARWLGDHCSIAR
jgi:two-component system chemotaxis response regulator CheB